MKKILLLAVFASIACILSGQNTAMEYMAQVPALSFDPCAAPMEKRQEFLDKLTAVDSALRVKLDSAAAESGEFQAEHEDETRINVLMKLGYSKEQAEKLKNADNMSEAELMAIANEMMVNKNNISIDEYKQVADYDTASQARWGKAQATMNMAEMQANPEKYEKEQKALKDDIDLQTELQFQRDKLRAAEDKYRLQIDTLDGEALKDREALNKQLEKLQKQLDDCQNESQCNQISEQMYQLQLAFCNKFTPRYLQIVEQFKAYLIDNFDEYEKWEELQIKSVESQTGVHDTTYKPGTYTTGVVGIYTNLLGNVFKYAPSVRVIID